MHNYRRITLPSLQNLLQIQFPMTWQVSITLPKYRAVFIIQMWSNLQCGGVSVTFWSGGSSTTLAKKKAEAWVQLSPISAFPNYRTSCWGCICMCTVTGRLRGQMKIRSRCKVCSWSMWTAQTRLFIFPKLLGKGSKHFQGHFLSQERKWAPLAKLLSDPRRINPRVKQEELKLRNWFLAERSAQKPTDFAVAGKTDFLDLVLHWVKERV